MPLSDTQRQNLEGLTRQKPVVLFMKGNRQFPQCGFSATVVGILDQLTSGYATVNILQDQAVRDGMKELSGWPTFPQLYVKGELVGGCDIIKSLHASGELAKLLDGLGPAPAAQAAPAPGSVRATLSPAAAKALNEALADSPGEVIRLEIAPDFTCDLHIAPKEAGDVEVTSSGATLHIGRSSAARADGIAIDFIEGPGGMAFKIDNPNAPPAVKRLAAKELKALLDAGRVELFDVRPETERARASIAAAKPLDEAGQRRLAGLPKDAAIALHCHHGVRSRAAAEELVRQGFTNVYNLEGGIEAWSRDVDGKVPRY